VVVAGAVVGVAEGVVVVVVVDPGEQVGAVGSSWHCRVVTRFSTYRRALATDDSCTPEVRDCR
jgi:hypothetical protein